MISLFLGIVTVNGSDHSLSSPHSSIAFTFIRKVPFLFHVCVAEPVSPEFTSPEYDALPSPQSNLNLILCPSGSNEVA